MGLHASIQPVNKIATSKQSRLDPHASCRAEPPRSETFMQILKSTTHFAILLS